MATLVGATTASPEPASPEPASPEPTLITKHYQHQVTNPGKSKSECFEIMLEKLRSVHRGLYSPSTIDTELYPQLINAVREVASPVSDFHGQGHFNVSFDNTSAMLYKEQCISKDHVLITIAATWEGEFILDSSRGTPIGVGHDDDIFAAIHGHLDSGDFDEQHANDEAICELYLRHKFTVKRSLTCLFSLLRRRLSPVSRQEYPSTYHRLMDMMHDHRQKRRRAT
ncbi:hypothetical protein E4U57_006985 [Claviceps arundinis]|uniref:Uncharacterized protein n=1 Tax=Claviceps arundinis TaxID=1623583 RepID=A0ABQ7PHT4_9HYPO|nr:hypothetical protein E4U57_006985 [Claviceps arundinis]